MSIQLLLQIATNRYFCPVEMKGPDVVVRLVDSIWPTQTLRPLFLLVPGDFWGMPWKGDAFNDLYLTRLGINLLVNLYCSTGKHQNRWWCDIFGRWAHQRLLPSTISLNTQGYLRLPGLLRLDRWRKGEERSKSQLAGYSA